MLLKTPTIEITVTQTRASIEDEGLLLSEDLDNELRLLGLVPIRIITYKLYDRDIHVLKADCIHLLSTRSL